MADQESESVDGAVLKAIAAAHEVTVARYKAGLPVTILRRDGTMAVIQQGKPDRELSRDDAH